ncbi:unnamed protein product [Caenorhabditis angaria]|uniref:Arf-GAP domain-containing protein n=1 Tax=Caenorhabditis angaria TaxID=860376 RepID=A0A9P1IIU1_9PELO|nr:unnamed protein product [Caenorhabditis angaria]
MLRGRVDPKKEEQERLQGILLDMLKEEENKYCADCQAKTPRWAAWNLGIFICIRCAGIHRNLGVHISKVRSVNLDSWTAEQVQTMRVMGNEKARQVYEHDLPAQFRRPTTDHAMEQFIRGKYEQKRYLLRDFVYPRVDVNDLPKSLGGGGGGGAGSGSGKKHPVVSISALGTTQNGGSKSTAAAPTISNLLDFSDPTPNSNSAGGKTATSQNLFDDFAGLSMQPANTAASNDDFDDFGSFVSASTQQKSADLVGGFADFSSAPSSSSNLADLTQLPVSNSQETSSTTNGGKKSNADILSLFGSAGAANSASHNIVAPGGFTAFGLQAAPQQQQAQSNDLYGGLGGINFGAAPQAQQQFGGFAPAPVVFQQAPPQQAFNIPNKSNAFADLALGKVMKTNYGQSALSTPAPSRISPQIPAQKTAPISTNNDLFDMFASAPPPTTTSQAPPTSTQTSTTNFDDLLSF